MKVIKSVLRIIRNRGDISHETLGYFLKLHNVPDRPVISSSSYFTVNISSFLDFHFKPLAQKVKSYIQDTNDFLKNIANLPPLPDDLILCTIDVVGLYSLSLSAISTDHNFNMYNYFNQVRRMCSKK